MAASDYSSYSANSNLLGLDSSPSLTDDDVQQPQHHRQHHQHHHRGGSGGGGNAGVMDLDDDTSVPHWTLTAKPHAFAGSVLSPKHARELTPALALGIAAALAEQAHRTKVTVPYTLWITEAWRVLGWAEPSAALFWEMATMYYTLYLAAQAFAADYPDTGDTGAPVSLPIPPILSCGSTSSIGSGTNNSTSDRASLDKKKFSATASAKELPVWLVGMFLLLHCEDFAYQRNISGEDERRFYGGGSHLPGGHNVGWSLGKTDVQSKAKNAGPLDFSALFKNTALSPRTRLHAGWNQDNSHCTAYLLRHLRKILLLVAVSHNPDAIRACMHLAALPAPTNYTGSTTTATGSSSQGSAGGGSASRRPGAVGGIRVRYSAEELRRLHDEEHGTVGYSVQLTLDDLERLHLVLQPPSGGGIEDPPVRLGDFLWKTMYRVRSPPPPTVTLTLADVEDEIRRHLELELMMAGYELDDKEDLSTTTDDDESPVSAMARLSLMEKRGSGSSVVSSSSSVSSLDAAERARQPDNQYHKELSYSHLRATTILLKPNPVETSSGVSMSSGEPNYVGNLASAGRLHDLVISDCSDGHFYLLQPFEHAMIASCTGCTIVVGAVAGLLHVVDCERTMISSAARRILVSNSSDVQLLVFTPSPPLLVGDNRTCQFAPYNTYYDGLREDLLATGLAAAVVSEGQPSYLGTSGGVSSGSGSAGGGTGGAVLKHLAVDHDATWPPLQCASNKWKQPIELAKLEVPQVPGSPAGSSPTAGSAAASPGADDKAMGKAGTGNDATMQAPILLPVSDYHILFVPVESDSTKQRRLDADDNEPSGPMESQYCRLLAEVLQLSPFRLPAEYERHVLSKADRMRTIQQAVQKDLTPEQQRRFEEELNRGFRDWLVTSGNLRQVLDLVHLERRQFG